MKYEPKDINGKAVRQGDRVAYTVKHGASADLLTGVVTDITESVEKKYTPHVYMPETRSYEPGPEQSYWTQPSFTITPEHGGRKVVEKSKVVRIEGV